jgi:hypothetical protein
MPQPRCAEGLKTWFLWVSPIFFSICQTQVTNSCRFIAPLSLFQAMIARIPKHGHRLQRQRDWRTSEIFLCAPRRTLRVLSKSSLCHCENPMPLGGMREGRNLQDAERPPMNRAGYGTASDESD